MSYNRPDGALVVIDPAGDGVVARLDTNNAASRITSQNFNDVPLPLDLEISALQIGGDAGTAGYVLTSTGASSAPEWQPTASVSTLQEAYDNGQSIDASAATGDLVFESASGDAAFLIGNGTDLSVTVDTGAGSWTQTSAAITLLASTDSASLRTVGPTTTVELTAAGAASGVGRGTQITMSSTGVLFKTAYAINNAAAPPAAASATLDLWGTFAAQIAPTTALTATTVTKYTAFSLIANTTLPTLAAGNEGRIIFIANDTANPITMTPPVGGAARARTLSPGGGSAWMWLGNDWICLGYA